MDAGLPRLQRQRIDPHGMEMQVDTRDVQRTRHGRQWSGGCDCALDGLVEVVIAARTQQRNGDDGAVRRGAARIDTMASVSNGTFFGLTSILPPSLQFT